MIYFSGDVFGSKDNFSGLGIFFDTYSNHNDAHSVRFMNYSCSFDLLVFLSNCRNKIGKLKVRNF